MGLYAHPTIIIPANYEVRQIAMVGARRLADRNIAAAVGNGCLGDSSRQLTPDPCFVRRWHHLRGALPEAAAVWIVDDVLHGKGRHCDETCQSLAAPHGSRKCSRLLGITYLIAGNIAAPSLSLPRVCFADGAAIPYCKKRAAEIMRHSGLSEVFGILFAERPKRMGSNF